MIFTKFEAGQPIRFWLITFIFCWYTLRHAVNFTFDRLTLNVCSVCAINDQTCYTTLALDSRVPSQGEKWA